MLTKLLFRLVVGLACALFLIVALAPWVVGSPPADDSSRFLATFAHDVVVRRTAVGAGIGLLVTAFVFFRNPGRPSSGPPIPPRNIAGA